MLVRKSLVQAFILLTLFSFGLLGAFFLFLSNAWQLDLARKWLFLASAINGIQLYLLWRDLSLNHRPDEKQLLPSFGLGSWLSFVRLLSISLLSGFLIVPEASGTMAWLPANIYLLANLSDFFDGYLARITNHMTKLGQKLDTVLDGRGLLIATLLAFHYDRVPWWYLSIGLARYLYTLGVYWRERRSKEVYELVPKASRRSLAGTLMVFSIAMLVPIFSAPETKIAASIFMIPFLSNFLIDWWQVSGRKNYLSFWRKFVTGFAPNGMLMLRLILVAIIILRIIYFPLNGIYIGIEILLATATLIAFLGRTAAAILLIEGGTRQLQIILGPADWAILFLASAVLFLGSGKFSMYAPEENWISRRAGEASEAQ